jgi:hypothetical protein
MSQVTIQNSVTGISVIRKSSAPTITESQMRERHITEHLAHEIDVPAEYHFAEVFSDTGDGGDVMNLVDVHAHAAFSGRTSFPTIGHAGFLFPVGPHIDLPTAALTALAPLLEPANLHMVRAVRHIDKRLMTARIIVAIAD